LVSVQVSSLGTGRTDGEDDYDCRRWCAEFVVCCDHWDGSEGVLLVLLLLLCGFPNHHLWLTTTIFVHKLLFLMSHYTVPVSVSRAPRRRRRRPTGLFRYIHAEWKQHPAKDLLEEQAFLLLHVDSVVSLASVRSPSSLAPQEGRKHSKGAIRDPRTPPTFILAYKESLPFRLRL